MMKRRGWIVGLLLTLLVAAGAGWFSRMELGAWWRGLGDPLLVLGRDTSRPDAERHAVLCEEAERWRRMLGSQYNEARTRTAKGAIEDEARVFLERMLPDLMRCWLGTPWDFQGTAEVPGRGEVACGYFVATVLRDAGFRVDRYDLAKQPSENILRTFLPRDEISRRVAVPYETYAAELCGLEPGVRIVGLDTHVGFLVTGAEGFRFIHSSGSSPWCVVDEGEEQAAVLERSNYRVQGSLTGNREVVRKWLTGERIRVVGVDP